MESKTAYSNTTILKVNWIITALAHIKMEKKLNLRILDPGEK